MKEWRFRGEWLDSPHPPCLQLFKCHERALLLLPWHLLNLVMGMPQSYCGYTGEETDFSFYQEMNYDMCQEFNHNSSDIHTLA
jgi:hypothetical protein